MDQGEKQFAKTKKNHFRETNCHLRHVFPRFPLLIVICSGVHICASHSITETGVLQVSANGNVLRSEIVGAIKMRVYLSGMPELRLGLNDKVLFESTGRKFRSHFLAARLKAQRPM